MKEIVLANARGIAVVDDEDYEPVARYRWCLSVSKRGVAYAIRFTARVNGRQGCISMHRAILMPAAGLCVDHINRNGLDNRRCNLRVATNSQNQFNKIPRTGRRFKGVYRDRNRWRAMINIGGGSDVHLGMFDTPEQAAMAYNAAALLHFGQFARVNDVG